MRLKIVDMYSQNSQLKHSYTAQQHHNAILQRQQEVKRSVASRACVIQHLKDLHSRLDRNIRENYLP